MKPISLALLFSACTGPDPPEEWGGAVDTLSNGAVRITNPSQGIWADGAGWRLVPEFQLGQEEGPEPLVFGAISGLAVDGAGRIYVLDQHANELRIFSGSGEHLRSTGRTGTGPGEYRSANGLFWRSPDTLLVMDQLGGRYSLLTREGDFIRSVRRQATFYGGWRFFAGGPAAGRMYERTVIGSFPDWQPALLGTSLQESDAPAARDTVLLPEPPAPVQESFRVMSRRGAMVLSVPFATEAVYHLDATGRVWHGHGSEFRLFRTTLAGDTIMEIFLEAPPTPVTATELAEWERTRSDSIARFRALGGELDMSRIPKVKPFFDGLYLDPEGHLLASVPAGRQETVFVLFDSGGRYLGRLEASGFIRNRQVSPVVRNDRLHLAGWDELHVPKIYVFRIAR